MSNSSSNAAQNSSSGLVPGLLDGVGGLVGQLLDILTGGTLNLPLGFLGTVTFDGTDGTLNVGALGDLLGLTVSGLQAGDTINLQGVNGTLTQNGNQLLVNNALGVAATVNLGTVAPGMIFVGINTSNGITIVTLPSPATVAQFTKYKADYAQVSGGIEVSDTATNIMAALAVLNSVAVNSINVTSGTVSESVANFTTYKGTLDKIIQGFTISDTAANITAALASLADSHINSITVTTGGVSVPVASFLANQTVLDKIVGGFSVADTGANIAAAIASLGDSHINSIASTSGAVSVLVATLTSSQSTLDKIVNGYSIADTAANIASNLAAIVADTSHINQITSTNGVVSVSTSTFAADQTTLDKITNGFSISDTAANVTSALASLATDSNIVSIMATGGVVSVPVSTFTADQAALDKIIGGFSISDTAANVTSALASLAADSNITSITATGGVVAVPVATLTADQAALDKIVGGFSISDTAANVTSALASLAADSNITSITATGGVVSVPVSTLTADQAALDKIVGGFMVSDTAANIAASLAALSDPNVIGIMASGGPLAVSVSTYLTNEGTLDKIAGGYTISDTGANIAAAIGMLTDPDITAITATSGVVSVPVSTFSANQAALDKIAGGFTVSDTGANISAAIASLADAHLNAIVPTSGVVSAPVSTFLANQATLDKVVGGFTISDTAANIAASIGSLSDANITSIASTSGVVSVPVSAFTADQTALDKIVGGFSVADTAANILAALPMLNADVHVDGISVTSGAVSVSAATYAADQVALDKIAGGFSIADTAANIGSLLPSLNDPNVSSLIVSDNAPVPVSVAELASKAMQIALLANASGGAAKLAVMDTASDISAGLDNLNGANIASITIADNAPITVSVGQLTSDAAALSKMVDGNGSPYQAAISDTAANIAAGLGTLEANLANIASITSTSGSVAVNAASYAADKGALDKVAGGFAISDTAANLASALGSLTDPNITGIVVCDSQPVQVNVAELTGDAAQLAKLTNASGGPAALAIVDTAGDISADLDNLNGSNIGSITISDGAPLTASLAQLTSDAAALSKIVTSGPPYLTNITDTAANIEAGIATLQSDLVHIGTVTSTTGIVDVNSATFAADQGALDKIVGGFDVTDSLPNLVSHLALFNADNNILSLSGTSGVATLSGGVPVNAPNIAITGAGTALTVAENVTMHNLNLGAGATVSVSADDVLSLSGSATLAGKASGAGMLATAGGTLTVSNAPTVATWWNANETINTTAALIYGGKFVAGGTTLNLGGALALKGTATLGGGSVKGTQRLQLQGATTVSGAETFGGSNGVTNSGTLTQSGVNGAMIFGDASGAAINFYNAPTGVIDIINNNGISLGNAAASTLSNAGLIEKTGGAGLSIIQPSIGGAGTITSQIGALELTGKNSSLSGALTGAGKIYFGGGGTTTLLSGATITVAGLRLTDAGTTLRVQTNLSYGGAFSQTGSTLLQLNPGVTLTLTGASTLGGSIFGGTLTMNGGSATIMPTATITTTNWNSTGTALTIADARTYAGAFAASSETITLNSVLNLGGAAMLSNDKLVGTSQIRFGKSATVGGVTVGGTTSLVNFAAVTQNGGDVVLGDSSNGITKLINTGASAVWNITDDSDILLGNTHAASIKNSGVIEKTGGSGVSVIADAILNGGNGTIKATSGTLDLQGAITGKGYDVIGAGATMNFDSSVANAQTIQFQGANAVLGINDWGAFSGQIAGFAAGDTIDVSGGWSFVAFNQTFGVMTFEDNGTAHSVKLTGSYIAADFHHTVVGGVTQVTYG